MKTIDLKTNTNQQSRATLLRRLANLPIENQIQVLKESLNFQFKNVDYLKEYSNPQKLYIALIESIYTYTNKNKFDRLDIENQKLNFKKQETIKVNKIRQRYTKKSVIADKLKSRKYWLIVKKLKIVDKLSYRAIAYYLWINHKFRVNYSTIAKVWKELEENA